jgi:hypothetical protein
MLNIFEPLILRAKLMRFGRIIIEVKIRNSAMIKVKIISEHPEWTQEDIEKRESLIE